jgi:hypothetical protein
MRRAILKRSKRLRDVVCFTVRAEVKTELERKKKPAQTETSAMPARKAVLTQTELKRYLAAYRDAGIPVGRTEIGPDGTVVIHSASENSPPAINDWDAD